jgi:hypothetical protein
MKSLARFRTRRGRCFELAYTAMVREPGAEWFTLVHGRVFNRGRTIDHAWIECGDGTIYDPVSDEYVLASKYMATRRAVAERRYSKVGAPRRLAAAGHYGPWHEAPAEPRKFPRGNRSDA